MWLNEDWILCEGEFIPVQELAQSQFENPNLLSVSKAVLSFEQQNDSKLRIFANYLHE